MAQNANHSCAVCRKRIVQQKNGQVTPPGLSQSARKSAEAPPCRAHPGQSRWHPQHSAHDAATKHLTARLPGASIAVVMADLIDNGC